MSFRSFGKIDRHIVRRLYVERDSAQTTLLDL